MTTYAPQQLLDLRRYLKPLTGLSDNELGIVGDASHNGGYHHGWSMRRIVNGTTADYSWNESDRDGNHKTDAASAFDVGNFPRLRELSLWLVRECESGAPDTLDIRSIIYTPDGVTVRRWDRLGRRISGNTSHLGHTHVSYFRDAEARSKIGPYQRFFEGVSMSDYNPFGKPEAVGDRGDSVLLADVWGQEVFEASPFGGGKSARTQRLIRIEEKIDALPRVPSADPDALAQALIAQPGFVAALGSAVAGALLNELREGLSHADQA